MANNTKTVAVKDTAKATMVGNKVVTHHSSVGTKHSSDLVEFTSRIGAISESAVAQGIANGQLKLVDHIIYSAKQLGNSTTVELMEAADQKKVGFRNLNKRQLEANNYMLVTGIQILATEDEVAEDKMGTSEYKMIGADIANGELEIKQGDKIIFPRNSCEIFRSEGTENKKYTGYYKLECPKMLVPLTDIVPTLWLPSGVNKAVKIVFHGVRTNG